MAPTTGPGRWSTAGRSNPPHLVMATYGDYKKAGPLLISTDHRGTVTESPFIFPFRTCRKLTDGTTGSNAQ